MLSLNVVTKILKAKETSSGKGSAYIVSTIKYGQERKIHKPISCGSSGIITAKVCITTSLWYFRGEKRTLHPFKSD